LDSPPEPDPNSIVRRLRKGRGGSAVGHAVLQVIDLATLAPLDALAQAAARDEDISDSVGQIKDYVRDAISMGLSALKACPSSFTSKWTLRFSRVKRSNNLRHRAG